MGLEYGIWNMHGTGLGASLLEWAVAGCRKLTFETARTWWFAKMQYWSEELRIESLTCTVFILANFAYCV